MADVIIRGVTYTGVDTIDAQADGGGTQSFIIPSGTTFITQNGVVDVTQYASANVNVSGGGGQTDLCSIDFSKTVGSYTLNGVDISSAGAVFTSNTSCFVLPLTRNGMTVEIDFGAITPSSGTNNRRLLNPRGTSNGLIYHYATGFWSLYNGSWHDSTITGMDAFANSTVKIEIDSSGYWSIYKTGTLLWTSNAALSVNGNVALQIGSNDTNALNTMTVLAVRVY